MQFRILGSLEVDRANQPLTLGGPRPRALLAHLIVRANELVPTDVLVSEVWEDDAPASARGTIHSYVSRLRKELGADRIEGQSPGYRLRLDPSELDAARFDRLVNDAKKVGALDPGIAASMLEEALGLWRGPALADVAEDGALRAEATRLDELRLVAAEERIEAVMAVGEHARVIGEAELLVAQHPLRERLWSQLMLALYRDGRQADALGAYQRLREILADELGVDPSPELARLHERILKQDPDLELRGDPLRGYRLLEKIGDGPTGVVFRAIQPRVGRDVAVKIVHEQIASDPAFVRRFEREAQAAAALEHPQIVPVYDYWREPGGAYIVSRYLRGGSLAGLLARGDLLAPDRASSVVEQIASALAFAHRQHVVHGRVGTSNVLFDGERNAYLEGFRVGVGPDLDPADDVRELARLAKSLFDDEMPHHLRDLVEMTLLRDEVPGAEPFVDAARTTAESEGLPAPHPADVRNPYKGLRPFTEADAHDFFGRNELTARLLSRLTESGPDARFLAVVGPSGAGKSSVVRAGMVPAIRQGALGDPQECYVAEMFPGTHPIDELEQALVRVGTHTASRLHDVLDRSSRGLLDALDLVLPEPATLVLVIDQFEEVFTLTGDEHQRELFLESLRVAALDPESRIRVIVTLRADFYDRPLTYPRFGELLAARTEAVPPLTPDEIEQAIRRPVEGVGIAVEPGLEAEIIADVAHQPGALPLLQYALTELFERRDGDRLTLAAFEEIGGVGGALSARADRIFSTTEPDGQRAIRQVFLRLVTIGERRQDTRRRVTRSELDALDVEPELVETAMDTYGRHRLLTFDREQSTREPTVEIAHEALLTAWARLRTWIDDAREDLGQDRRLSRAAGEWRGSDRDPSFLLRGSRLEQVAAWTASTDLAVGRPEREYVKASVDQRDRELEEERARHDREERTERRSRSRLRALVAVLTVAALVAGTLTVIATRQSDRAETEARVASARELAAAALANLENDQQLSVLLAMEAVNKTRSVDGTVLREAEEALHRAVTASRIVTSVPGSGEAELFSEDLWGAIDWGPAGLVVMDGDFASEGPRPVGIVDLRDQDTGEIVRSLPGHDGKVTGAEFSPDGSILATTGEDGRLKIWDLSSYDLIRNVKGAGVARGPSFSADGSRVAAAFGGLGRVGSVRVVELNTGKVQTFSAAPFTNEVALSPDGRRVVAVGGFAGEVFHLIDVETGEVRRIPNPQAYGLTSVAWSPDGRHIAAGSFGPPVVMDTNGRVSFFLEGHEADAYWVEWSSDSTRLLTGSLDGTAKVWEFNTQGASEALTLSARAGEMTGIAFSPDGTRVMTRSDTRVMDIWEVGPGGGAEVANIADADQLVSFLADGRRVTTSGWDGSLSTLDLETGEKVHQPIEWFEPPRGLYEGYAFNQDGSAVAIETIVASPPL